jgi:hypothetical protein
LRNSATPTPAVRLKPVYNAIGEAEIIAQQVSRHCCAAVPAQASFSTAG